MTCPASSEWRQAQVVASADFHHSRRKQSEKVLDSRKFGGRSLLPFGFESQFHLPETLKAIGTADPFDPAGDGRRAGDGHGESLGEFPRAPRRTVGCSIPRARALLRPIALGRDAGQRTEPTAKLGPVRLPIRQGIVRSLIQRTRHHIVFDSGFPVILVSLLRVLSRVPKGLVNVVARSTLILSFRRDPNGAIHRSESDLPKRLRAGPGRNRPADEAVPALGLGQDELSHRDEECEVGIPCCSVTFADASLFPVAVARIDHPRRSASHPECPVAVVAKHRMIRIGGDRQFKREQRGQHPEQRAVSDVDQRSALDAVPAPAPDPSVRLAGRLAARSAGQGNCTRPPGAGRAPPRA